MLNSNVIMEVCESGRVPGRTKQGRLNYLYGKNVDFLQGLVS